MEQRKNERKGLDFIYKRLCHKNEARASIHNVGGATLE